MCVRAHAWSHSHTKTTRSRLLQFFLWYYITSMWLVLQTGGEVWMRGSRAGGSEGRGAEMSRNRRKQCLLRRLHKQQWTLLPRWHRISHQLFVLLSLLTCWQGAKTQCWALSPHADWCWRAARHVRAPIFHLLLPYHTSHTHTQADRESCLIAALCRKNNLS